MLYNENWKFDPVSDVLLRAADLIEKGGLAKGTRHDGAGGMCFLGAVEAAQGLTQTYTDTLLTHQAAERLVEALGLTLKNDGIRYDDRTVAARWNNAKERTQQEVVDAMRKAAKLKVAA